MSSTWVGRPLDAEHAGHREAVDVGVDDADPQPALRPATAARLTVTDDLPTPPLPEATAYTRVSEPGRANGISCSAGPPRSCSRRLGALLVAHHAERHVDGGDARRPSAAPPWCRGSASPSSGSPRPSAGSSTAARRRSRRRSTDFDHAELGDGLADLGVVDRRQRGEQCILGRGRHASMLGRAPALGCRGSALAPVRSPTVPPSCLGS